MKSGSKKKVTATPLGTGAARWHALLQGVLMLVFLAVSTVAPRADAIFLFLLGALSLFYAFAVHRRMRAIVDGPESKWFLTALFILAAYLFVNSFWAQKPELAAGKALLFLFLVLAVLAINRTFALQKQPVLDLAARFAVIGLAIGTAVACFEFLTGHLLERLIYTAWPAIRPGEKTIDVFVELNGKQVQLAEEQFRTYDGNVTIKLASSTLGRNLALMLLLAWPVLYMAQNQKNRLLASASLLTISVAATIAIIIGQNQTVLLALAGSLLVFLIAFKWPRFVHWAVTAAWSIALVFAIGLSNAPYKAGLHNSKWLFSSARERIVIWDYTIQQMNGIPVLGKGIRSTRFIGRKLKENETRVYDGVSYRRLALHSHNNFLQIWFELGAVGAVLVLICGFGILHRMHSMADSIKPFAYATFVGACIIAAFGWGLWQTWLLCGYAFAIILMSLASQWAGNHVTAARAPRASRARPAA